MDWSRKLTIVPQLESCRHKLLPCCIWTPATTSFC